jgi:hypothetical protein
MIEKLLRSIARQFLLYLAKKVGEPIVEASVAPDLKRAMPSIYEDLDGQMVRLLTEAGPVAMTTAIGQIIESKVNRTAEFSDIKAVIRDYSPILAALRGLSKP